MTGPGVGDVLAGHRIDALVGRGGMGVVYLATHLALDRRAALKVVAPEHAASEEFRARFAREWRTVAQLEHPNVVAVHDAGDERGVLYIAMGFVEGLDLGELIAAHGRLPPELAASILAQVAGALQAAHVRGLVHRDVKPANVLVTARRGAHHAVLTDFGLAKDGGGEAAMTAAGVLVGTLDYMAPEQIAGASDVDARADVYALGCVLYHALSGEVPFPRPSTASKLWAHVHEDPPRLADVVPGAPVALEAIVRRAMGKDPGARFHTAREMEVALRAAAAGRPAPDQAPALARAVPPPSLTASEAAERFRARTGHVLDPGNEGPGWRALCPRVSFDERGLLSEPSRLVIEAYGRFKLYALEDPAALGRVFDAEGAATDPDPDGIHWARHADDPRAPEEWVAIKAHGTLVSAWQAGDRAIDETWRRLDDLVASLGA